MREKIFVVASALLVLPILVISLSAEQKNYVDQN